VSLPRSRASAARGRSGGTPARWILTCEHARFSLPREYRSLGLRRAEIQDHIGWDIGAHAVQREVARLLGAPYIASRWSRLLVDCNRGADEATLIVSTSDGVGVPGNAGVSAAERRRRLRDYYEPYHAAVDTMIRRARATATGGPVRLLSLHSFTPVFAGNERHFEIGVLFDEHEDLARRLGGTLRRRGYRVRYNEPYSGRDGLIYSARRHGRTHDIDYVELEINNRLIRSAAGQRRLGRDVAAALSDVS
jgi:predicted N-formylglutamate amidohydrolase